MQQLYQAQNKITNTCKKSKYIKQGRHLKPFFVLFCFVLHIYKRYKAKRTTNVKMQKFKKKTVLTAITSKKSDVENQRYGPNDKLRQYVHMKKETHALLPLQDWSVDKWQEVFQYATEDTSRKLYEDLGLSYETNTVSDLKIKLDGFLSNKEWQAVVQFQNEYVYGADENAEYFPSEKLKTNMLFKKFFPLGNDTTIMKKDNRWTLGVEQSGDSKVKYGDDEKVKVCGKTPHRTDFCIFIIFTFALVGSLIFLIRFLSLGVWDIENTNQNPINITSTEIAKRTKDRGTVASIFAALTYSLAINAAMDAFGKIDPSTSTVLLGMVCGGTWGFILDNMFGTDEGFREYLFSPWQGMLYALGTLRTWRFARYIITILFDVFFTVILFRQLYSRIVQLRGFSKEKFSWLANGFVSFFISVLTFQVYANTTRFEWAYPSGKEDLLNQWISGSTMILITSVMAIVFLVSETRLRFGERGINNPNVKIWLVIATFLLIWFLNWSNAMDPSKPRQLDQNNNTIISSGIIQPLPDVVCVKEKGIEGLFFFFFIITFSILGVVETSKHGRGKKWCLRGTFIFIAIAIFLAFAVIPFWSATDAQKEERETYQEECVKTD